MSIKYGEVTVIYNKDQSIFNHFLSLFNNDENKLNNPKYIFLFDDDEICEYNNDKLKYFNFQFSNSISHKLPLYFEKIGTIKYTSKIYFYKNSIEKEKNKLINIGNLFNSYSKYNLDNCISSDFNCIYHNYKTYLNIDILGIVRIKSNDYMPRYQFAYDSDEFTKEEIIYLIYKLLNSL
jgi:hypothetical protein